MAETCCTNSVEMRKMIEEVAEKAAERAASKLSSDIKLEMIQRDIKIRDEIADTIDQKFRDFFGMTPHEHFTQHSQFASHMKSWEDMASGVGKKVGYGIVIAILGALGISTTGLPLNKDAPVIKDVPAIVREERLGARSNEIDP